MKLSVALSLLESVRQVEEGTYKALCPAHNDRTPSLSVSKGNAQELVMHCHAGCDYSDIHKTLVTKLKTHETSYEYKRADGSIIGRVIRSYDDDGNKHFYQQILYNNGWKNGSSTELKNTPYRLPELLEAINKEKSVIFIVEGEKDVDRLFNEGRIATCNAQGAGKWTDEHSKWLNGAKHILIVRDNDTPGERHAWAVCNSIEQYVTKVTVRVSPFAKDVSEHLDSGHKLSDLIVEEPKQPIHSRLVSGYDFIFNTPAEVPAIWGYNGKEVLWARDQGFMILAPESIGKSTLANLLVEALLGLTDSVLDFPVVTTQKRIIYMAMDRHHQWAGAARRIFEKYKTTSDAQKLKEQLLIWPGPPEQDFVRHPELLTELTVSAGAEYIFIDSLKDAVIGLSKEESGQGWNRAVQLAIHEGVQVCVLNHPSKINGKDIKPITVDDSYGSKWITSGSGSILSLWGDVDSSFATLSHIKPPAIPIDPLTIRRNGRTGQMEAVGTILDWAWFFAEPHSVTDLATKMFGDEITKANEQKARRQVDDLLARYAIVEHSKVIGQKGKPASKYILREPE